MVGLLKGTLRRVEETVLGTNFRVPTSTGRGLLKGGRQLDNDEVI